MIRMWTESDKDFLLTNYPQMGKLWCAKELGRGEGSVRWMASQMQLRINPQSGFFKEFQSRAAKSKIGKKRPEQSKVIRASHADGKMVWNDKRKCAASKIKKEWFKNNAHPRGALGMKHTQESKDKISSKGKERWVNMGDEERDKYSLRGAMLGLKIKNREKCSWKAAWREIGGKRKYFRSRWEANFARYLEFLKTNGDIIEWEHEPETFWFEGIKRGCMSYLVDFKTTEKDGTFIYYEVKGWMDDRSKTKLNRMKKYYPNIELRLVDSKAYKRLAKNISGFIPSWE